MLFLDFLFYMELLPLDEEDGPQQAPDGSFYLNNPSAKSQFSGTALGELQRYWVGLLTICDQSCSWGWVSLPGLASVHRALGGGWNGSH